MGPLPTYSLICWNGSVLRDPLRHDEAAGRAGLAEREAAASGRASSATSGRCGRPPPTSSFWTAREHLPHAGRAASSAWMEATTSFASTGSLSWKRRPSRRRKVQVRPSAETSSPSTICGCGSSCLVHAVEQVPHHRRGVAHDVLRAPDRVEIGEVRLRHEAQRPRRGALRQGGRGKARGAERRGGGAGRGFQEAPAIHPILLPTAGHPPGFVPACPTLGQRASAPDADAAREAGAGRHPSVFVRETCTPRAKLAPRRAGPAAVTPCPCSRTPSPARGRRR